MKKLGNVVTFVSIVGALFGLLLLGCSSGITTKGLIAVSGGALTLDGKVYGGENFEGQIINVYIDHVLQPETTTVKVWPGQQPSYSINLLAPNVQPGSTIILKIGNDTYGIATYEARSRQTIDLHIDEKGGGG